MNDFISAAVELTDELGLGALSMRAIADRLKVRTMATYSFAPNKVDLTALMVDRAYRGVYEINPIPMDGWRSALRTIAYTNRELHFDHPWLHQLQVARSPMGPHELRKTELELKPLEGIGLADFEMDQTLVLIQGYAREAARLGVQLREERSNSGLADDEWWVQAMPVLEQLVDPTNFPLTTRVGKAASHDRNGEFGSNKAFEFGLDRLLDGISILVDQRLIR